MPERPGLTALWISNTVTDRTNREKIPVFLRIGHGEMVPGKATRKPARVRVASIARIAIFTILAALEAVLPAAADIFSYRDENGVIHFSNVPTDLRYRFKL